LDFKRQGLKQVPDEIGNFLSIYIWHFLYLISDIGKCD
jgi:hypothetical protein